MLLPMQRRTLLTALAAAAGPAGLNAAPLERRRLEFPADFGAHPQQRIEWWYLTGHLTAQHTDHPNARDTAPASSAPSESNPRFGFQITFFRTRTGVDPTHPSRFAASQLLFAHAALTDLRRQRLLHDQRIARQGFGLAEFDLTDTRLTLKDWTLARQGPVNSSRYSARFRSPTAGFDAQLEFEATQAPLLQGEGGWSRKGPQPDQASHYYSRPQLQASGTVQLEGRAQSVRGQAWLDHEWSDSLLDAQAVGWDWIGMNLLDGSALTAFRLRRADGSALYGGGSMRRAGAPDQSLGAHEVRFTPRRFWTSPRSAARYPVQWALDCRFGQFEIRALLDDQELDSRASSGAIYWEGLSELLDVDGRRIGLGYLEMTGYAAALRL